MLHLVQKPVPQPLELQIGMEVALFENGRKIDELIVENYEPTGQDESWKVRMKSLLWPQDVAEFYLTPDKKSNGWCSLQNSDTLPESPTYTFKPLAAS